METQLAWSTTRKHLCLRFRERYATADGLQAKVVGELDTVTGGFEFVARADKVVGPLPLASAPWRVKRRELAAPRAAVGVAYCSRRDAVLARASVSGASELAPELWLEAAAAVEADARGAVAAGGAAAVPAAPARRGGNRPRPPPPRVTSSPTPVTASCRLALAKNVFDFAPCQQVRVAVGVDGATDGKGGARWAPWACVRENNWSAWMDLGAGGRGRVSVRYDL